MNQLVSPKMKELPKRSELNAELAHLSNRESRNESNSKHQTSRHAENSAGTVLVLNNGVSIFDHDSKKIKSMDTTEQSVMQKKAEEILQQIFEESRMQ